MKIKELLLFGVIGMTMGVVTGCNELDDVVSPETEQADVNMPEIELMIPDTAKTVSIERVIEIASTYKGADPMSRSNMGRVVETVETVNDENGEALMYVVNYAANRGFVIISAKKDYYPVLAENDEGHFNIPQGADGHPVYLWLDEQKALLKHSVGLPAEVKKEAAGQWMSFNTRRRELSRELASRAGEEKPQVYYDSLMRWSQDPNIEVYTYEDYVKTQEYRSLPENVKNEILSGMYHEGNSNYGSIESSTLVLRRSTYNSFKNQLLQTEWYQAYGFNKYVPGYNKSDDGQYPLGCATVAAGQIMRYHEYPTSIAWSKMANTIPDDYNSSFLYELALKIGVVFSIDKGSAEIEDAKKALTSYGYKVSLIDHNVGSVENELRHSRPVYMRGKDNNRGGVGHAWVCSGLSYQQSTTEISFMTLEYRPTSNQVPSEMVEAYHHTNLDYVRNLFYMNWGEILSSNNAYYLDTNIKYTGEGGIIKNFNSNRKELLIQK